MLLRTEKRVILVVKDRRADEEALYRTLRMLAPGTALHEGLENVLRAKTGALILLSNNENALALVSGGFRIDADFHPSALYELAKMDGAIVLSGDAKRILYANTQLTPDAMIPTSETGTRHRTAERLARQTGDLVISISQRRNVITVYRGSLKYVLRDIGVILAKANQALSTLERYKSVLDQALTNLSALEFEDLATLVDVGNVIQRAQMVQRIANEIDKYVAELGTEGRLVEMQLQELLVDIEDEGFLVMKDYTAATEERSADQLWKDLCEWDAEEILDLIQINRNLGYGSSASNLDLAVTPQGYRILTKIRRLPMPVVENLVRHFGRLPNILSASIEDLDSVEGIGEVRAKAIREGLRRLREQALLDRHM